MIARIEERTHGSPSSFSVTCEGPGKCPICALSTGCPKEPKKTPKKGKKKK